jgi:CubicO group peptidase (beta-lactamase class C family)
MPRENAKEANVMVARRLVLLGLVAAGLASALPLAARTPESRAVTLDAQLQQLVASRTTPGVAVLILQDGKSAYERAVGVRDPRGGEPLRTDRLIRLASMTKPVTSVAAMMLVEEGRIGLDDPLSKHLPQFAGLQVRRADGGLEPARRPPTIRELLTHTAGFSYTFMNRPGIVDAYREARVVDGLSDPAVTLGEAMWRLAGAPLAFQPGTEWHYSLATDVLGAVIERVSGQPLDAFVLERIARPLGLASWTFHAPEAARERLVVVTAPQQGGGTRLVASPDPVPFPATHGTALLDPERAFSATAYPSGGAGMIGTIGAAGLGGGPDGAAGRQLQLGRDLRHRLLGGPGEPGGRGGGVPDRDHRLGSGDHRRRSRGLLHGRVAGGIGVRPVWPGVMTAN